MRTKLSPRFVRHLSLISLLLVFFALGISNLENTTGFSAACPSPFTAQGNICVLTQDETISTTIELASNTTLDCKKFKLSAATPGTGVDPWPGSRSTPEVAIFLDRVQNVVIRNCTFEKFDFGIIALNSKDPRVSMQRAQRRTEVKAKAISFTPIRIVGNTITARFTAISLVAVDQAEIRNNTLRYLTKGGRALYVARNSDANVIQQNNVTADFTSGQTGAVMMPGPSMAPAPTPTPAPGAPVQSISVFSSNPKSDAAPAVLVTQILGPEPVLLNAIIGGPTGTLHQIAVPGVSLTEDPAPPPRPEDLSQGNLIDDNEITYPSPAGASPLPTPIAGNDGIVISVATGTVVSNNRIWYAAASIRAGIQIGSGGVKQFPGKCSLDATRLCLQDLDCNIPGFDQQSKGTCKLPPLRNVSWVASDNTINNNQINGPFGAGIVLAASETTIQGNQIHGDPGNLTQGAWRGTGIDMLGKRALETTTVTSNAISNVQTGIRLQQRFVEAATTFTTKVYENNITDYGAPVRTTYDVPHGGLRYSLPTELSVNGRGNYWGPCPPGFDPNKVIDLQGALNCDTGTGVCMVTDQHALCTPALRVQPSETRAQKRQQKRSAPRKKN